jgi:hypothetical protein
MNNMLSVHIVSEAELPTNRRKAPYRVELRGVSRQVTLDEVGNFDPFGMAWFHSNGLGSVLSQGRAIDDGANVEFDPYHDEYTLEMGDWKWNFGRNRGALVYTMRMEDLVADNPREYYDITMPVLEDNEVATTAIEKVVSASRLYIQRELDRFDKAKRLFIRMIRNGKILNVDVTPTNIMSCIMVHGPQLAREREHRTRVPREMIDLSH